MAINGLMKNVFGGLVRRVTRPRGTPAGVLPPSAIATDLIDGLDSVLLLDVSISMEYDDYPPTRISAAVAAAKDFITERQLSGRASRIGIVGFAGGSHVLHAMHPSATPEPLFSILDPFMPLYTFTNIANGLSLAHDLIERVEPRASCREIILLTDGCHNHGPAPLPVADHVKSTNCTIYTVGIGSSKGEFDEPMLKAIASIGPDGRPLYRFIADRNGLRKFFGDLGGGLTR